MRTGTGVVRKIGGACCDSAGVALTPDDRCLDQRVGYVNINKK